MSMFYKIHGVRIIIRNKNKILVLKRADSDKSDSNLWDIPGGKIEQGESIDDAIKREVLEEIGVAMPPVILKDLHGLIFEDFDDVNKLVIAVFFCDIPSINIHLNPEHSEYEWIDVKELTERKLGRILRSLQPFLSPQDDIVDKTF
ncbi:hypothetical protein COT99_00415 [Candidatus Falkowbacteria bacterium CG10_big_fil_rev_8_21_14_0_10_43_10]|uniref:Nudix hydrolase domain-containing protein n=1 Tax=Candidatus Falkowbacteria bacterium CG10_big_fil_rev_8_21_14_0_10_43_10 TaxID=1974567 RepID=A0A2H0V331_9BACT|nr:MAG: hypothetical protein COT99_00415 [Candidatus Falkowbacteria bacterium CG10_big_fil_rev_8_21_14_0_10_43_10]